MQTFSASEVMFIVVAAGTERGARLALTDQRTRTIGRSPQADLVVTDPRVSRRHLEIAMRDGAVHVRTSEGAGPFEWHGGLVDDALLSPGDELLIGDTRLRIEGARSSSHTTSMSADAMTLLDTRLTEIQGFAAVFAMSEALERAETTEDLERAIDEWARRYVPAREVRISAPAGDDPAFPARTAHIAMRAAPDGGTIVTVPAMAAHGPPHLIELQTAAKPEDVTDYLRRLLLIAGRLCAAAFNRLRAVEKAQEETSAMRSLAVGSARAFLGTSAPAERLAKLIPKLAASDSSLLIEGETGTGKSFVARLIHEASARARGPFRVLNCAAIPENLIESELFGHEKGAFTGAVASRPGAFESAAGGTLFLDEIGELPLASQAKLLRVLEDRRFERIGSNRTLQVDARVLAATNRNLSEMVKLGRFRSDLFYRISVVTVAVPALGERGDDLVLLAHHLLSDLAQSAGRRVTGFSSDALDAIRRYSWPGNVRELRNAIEHALVLGEGSTIELHDLPSSLSAFAAAKMELENEDLVRLPSNLADLESRAVAAALKAAGGNVTRAAAILGIARATLYTKLQTADKDGEKGGVKSPT